jgi:hypothetical protein
MYGNFAGRDASRGMAKQSFDIGTSLSLSLYALLIADPILMDRNANADKPTT